MPRRWNRPFFARDLAGTLVQVGVPTREMHIDLPMIEFFRRQCRGVKFCARWCSSPRELSGRAVACLFPRSDDVRPEEMAEIFWA
jgi:hypothetical protein